MNCVLDLPNKKVIFMHVPKNGGISIRRGVFRVKEKFFGPERLTTGEFKGFFKFGFVRNSYARMVSCLHWARKRFPDHFKWKNLSELLDIVEDRVIPYTFEGGEEWKKRGPDFYALARIRHHGIPQWHPYNCLQHADLVGRVENFQEDFDRVMRILDLPRKKAPHLNRTKHGHYSQYFSDSTRERVARLCAGEIKIFGFKFEEKSG